MTSLVHLEKGHHLIPHTEMRAIVTEVTGIASSLPKNVTTACNKRRTYSRISRIPESVTCPACRTQAVIDHTTLVDMAESALQLMESGHLEMTGAKIILTEESAHRNRDMAERYK